MQHFGLVTFVLACTLPGCTGDFDGPTYSTEHTRIFTTFNDPLCAGDLAGIDRHIAQVEEHLGTQLHDTLDVFLWNFSEPLPDVPCPYGRDACYVRSSKRIYTNFGALEHELNHGVIAELGNPKPFLDEGVATAMESRMLRFSTENPSAQINLGRGDVSYQAGAFFTRWLLDTHGVAKWRDLYSGRGSRAAFERIYGVSFDDAVEDYLATAPWVYAPISDAGAPTLASSDDGWRERVQINCQSDDTFGRPGRRITIRRFVVQEDGHFDFWTTADGLSLRQVPRDDLTTASDTEAALSGDVPLWDELSPSGTTRWVEGGKMETKKLVSGEYQISVVDIDSDDDDAVVTILPHRGPLLFAPAGAL